MAPAVTVPTQADFFKKPRKRVRFSRDESVEQTNFVNWFRWAYPDVARRLLRSRTARSGHSR